MIFNNLKRLDLWVIVFRLVKLLQMNLRLLENILNLIINQNQKQKKAKKQNTLDSVNALYEGRD